VVVGAAVAGARLGLRPISDNSTLVHLRTGIDLVRTWHIPRTDPYSFTAPGHPWVVQSWLASLLYGLANEVGHHALIYLQGALTAAVAAIVALTARGPTAWRSGLAATLAIAASAPGWSPRPLLIEFVCLALVVLIVERRAHPGWLIPVVWVWVNSHGSWPIGLAWLGARAAGEMIDRRGWPRVTLPRLAGFVAGLGVALLNPLTWRLLTFPLVSVQKEKTFQGIVEWRSPNFQQPDTLIAGAFILLSLIILLRARLPWTQLLPVCAFLALGLIAQRNLAPLGIVLAPALATALAGGPTPLRPSSVGISGRLAVLGDRAHQWLDTLARAQAWSAAVLGVAAVVTIGLVVVATVEPVLDLHTYPVAATDFLARTGRLGPAHRIAAVDVVGCYLIWRAGPTTKVWIDDRYDMYPTSVVNDNTVLVDADPTAPAVLERRQVDTVLWATNTNLPAILIASGGWQVAYQDARWEVLEREGPAGL